MTEPAAPAHAEHAEHAEHGHAHTGPHHPASFYVKIWAILLVLLAISIAGPVIGEITKIQAITLFTAFGIAIVKAYLVAANFMHLAIEKKLATMIIATALAFMGLFFFGVAPDVMKHEGDQWVNTAAREETARRIEREGEHGEKMGGHGSGGAHAEHADGKH
jgi:caa(3)-type oxidase subunit IV